MRQVAALVLMATAVAGGRCPGLSWTYSDGQCYWLSTFVVPWVSTADICAGVHPEARPASVHSSVVNTELASLLDGEQAWVGLSRADNSSSWAWSDGSPVNYQDWDSGQPGPDNCALVNHNSGTGQWGTDDCSAIHRSVCQVTARSGCAWNEFQGRCYATDDVTLPFSVVAPACELLGPWALPASVHSDEENAFLLSLVPSGGNSVWIGLSRPNSSAAWTWADGTATDYLNWGYGGPPDGLNCAVMVADVGLWIAVPCALWFPFFCQYNA